LKQPLLGAKGEKEGVTDAVARCAIRLTQLPGSLPDSAAGKRRVGGQKGERTAGAAGSGGLFAGQGLPPGMQ